MKKELYGYGGNKTVATHIVKKYVADVCGYFDIDTPVGEYDYFDVFITIDNIQHCLTEGEPFFVKPTKTEIKDLVTEFLSEI